MVYLSYFSLLKMTSFITVKIKFHVIRNSKGVLVEGKYTCNCFLPLPRCPLRHGGADLLKRDH